MSQQFQLEDQRRDPNQPNSELDLWARLVRSQVDDEWLRDNNLGTGNYSDAEMWQQVERFRDGLHGEAVLDRVLFERALAHAKEGVALNGFEWFVTEQDGTEQRYRVDGWADLDETERRDLDRGRWLRNRTPKKWAQIPDEQKLSALGQFGGLGQQWAPPHWRMVQMVNESSRSRGARLLDNITGRIKQTITNRTESAQEAIAMGNGHRKS